MNEDRKVSTRIDNVRVQRLRFSLRTAFVAITVAAVFAWLSRHGLHLVFFLTAVIATAGFYVAFRRARRRSKPALAFALVVSGLALYVASIGPAVVLFEGIDPIDEFLEIFYGPLILVDEVVPSRPVNDYADMWHRTFHR